jgi:hypothetical protein
MLAQYTYSNTHTNTHADTHADTHTQAGTTITNTHTRARARTHTHTHTHTGWDDHHSCLGDGKCSAMQTGWANVFVRFRV